MIEVDKVGLIESGDDVGLQVKVLNDAKNTGGFVILTGSNLDDPKLEVFDSWVANNDELERFFNESNWTILWQ